MMTDKEQNTAKRKATLASQAALFKAQTVKVNKHFEIRRLDPLNWQIYKDGKELGGASPFYFGSVTAALQSLPRHALNLDTQNSIQGITDLLKGIRDDILKLQWAHE